MASQCIIEVNPDIAGIGVRLSIYAQALLSLTPGIIFIYHSTDPKLTLDERTIIEITRSMLVILFTGTALLVSTVVQAKTFGLTAYHTLIVLNLSWLNNLTAAGSLCTCWGCKPQTSLRPGRFIFAEELKTRSSPLIPYTLALLEPLESSLVYWIFGQDVKVIDPSFGSFWYGAYIVAGMPFGNILSFYLISVVLLSVLMAIFWAAKALERMVTTITKKKSRSSYPSNVEGIFLAGSSVLSALIFDVLLILTTEMTIAHNLVSSEESRWTFGQTLALMLVVPLGWAAFLQAREVQRNVARRKAASAGTSGSADTSLQPQIALNDNSSV